MLRIAFVQLDRLAPRRRGLNVHAEPLENARQREEVAGGGVDEQHMPSDKVFVR